MHLETTLFKECDLKVRIKKIKIRLIEKYFQTKGKYEKTKSLSSYVLEYPSEYLANLLVRNFKEACYNTLVIDSQIADSCDPINIINMEEFVASKEYFKRKFELITGKNAGNRFIKEVFDDHDHVHVHNPNKADPLTTFQVWPKPFQNYFQEVLSSSNARSIYENFNYSGL